MQKFKKSFIIKCSKFLLAFVLITSITLSPLAGVISTLVPQVAHAAEGTPVVDTLLPQEQGAGADNVGWIAPTRIVAQAFRTGSTGGDVSAFVMQESWVNTNYGEMSFDLGLYSIGGEGEIGSKLLGFNASPEEKDDGILTFLPDGNYELEPSTTYWLVATVSGGDFVWRITNASYEGSGSIPVSGPTRAFKANSEDPFVYNNEGVSYHATYADAAWHFAFGLYVDEESVPPTIDPLDFNEAVNKSAAPGDTVVIDDIVIIGGQGSDVLDLNLYATGGTFGYSIVGEVDDNGTGANIQFQGTRDDLNATLQTLTFTSVNSGEFRVEARLGGQDGEIYNPDNGHVYRIVPGSMSWSAAKTAAEGMTYKTIPGYLATITTPKEHSIIVDRISGDGWIGGNDIASEGVWRWMTGPEAGQQFWQGAGNGSAVNSMFANWAPNEPNNANGNEDCAEFRTSVGGRWNDIPCDNPRPYYVVEFGTYGNLPEVTLVTFNITVDLMVDNEIFSCGVVIDESGTYTLGANLTLGTFQEDCITINADDVTLDGNGHTISGHANSNNENGVYVYESSNVIVVDMDITGFHGAIYVDASNGVTIKDNVIKDAYDDGIEIDYTSDVTITNNTLTNTADDGISVYDSEDITIENNTITAADDGIFLEGTTPFVVRNNTITATEIGIEIDDWNTAGQMIISGNKIVSGQWGIDLGWIGGVEVLDNRIQSDQWIRNENVEEDLGQSIFSKDGKGNRYYFADGKGSWTIFDIKDNNKNNFADVGGNLPFKNGLSFNKTGSLASFSTLGENPTWIDRVTGWTDSNSDDVFDNDAQTTLDFQSDDAEFASFHYIYDLEDRVSNVKWFVNHSSGSEELTIPQACLLEWDEDRTRIGLMVDIDLGLNTVQFRCAEEAGEGLLAYEGFGKTVALTEPFKISETWITYSESGQNILWKGDGQDAHPYTETAVVVAPTKKAIGSGGGGSRTTTTPVTTAPTTTPATTTPAPAAALNSGQCPANMLITQNLKVGARNGLMNSFTKASVKEVALLQTHINRILAAQFNQAAGPVDGIFGPKTALGVQRLQQALRDTLGANLGPTQIDGVVGQFTRNAINNSCGGMSL